MKMDHDSSPKGWLFGPWYLGRFSFVVSRDDLWVGFYWDRSDKTLYFSLLPMFVFGVSLLPTQRDYLPDLDELFDGEGRESDGEG